MASVFSLNNVLNEDVISSSLKNVSLSLKREDVIHEYVSGNKYRKLKYNIQQAQKEKKEILLTFGGAFSNHIAAVSAIGSLFGLKTIGVVRGEELKDSYASNATLLFAKSQGMQFEFVSRSVYREKNTESFVRKLKEKFGDFYLIPEGGTNNLAVKGCEEILADNDNSFDFICCPVGTGGTISGLINSSLSHQKIIGFPALKGDFLRKDISKFANKSNWELISDYHFGGYAKINTELISFINQFKVENNIQLDPVYTGKMMFGIFDLIKKEYFPKDSKILAIHTGGLQGIEGMNARLKRKGMPLIQL
ncbi:1-aminocyclopropane-1-carboxylate deaminase/D-cysteine desulfhydrase [Corallibacter sp.]|uniref:1-aminocyclopropane-1-carboxylate deaminase/D-cysteine desulfhydrase n=1 Tax=Corallibacter sp. TaxID=2038084 RepID=UPI003A90A5C0